MERGSRGHGPDHGGGTPPPIRRDRRGETRTPFRRPEEALQKAVAAYLDAVLPPEWRWFHVPNQRGTRKAWENKLLKAMGVKAGVPDIVLLGPDARVAFIELKAGKGTLSADQKDWRDWIIGGPGDWFGARSVADVERALHYLGVPIRGALT